MVTYIQDLRKEIGDTSRTPSRIAIELNTSCPNIRNASPSGYSFKSLVPLLQVLSEEFSNDKTLTIGLKMPPYVYREQFTDALEVLATLADTTSSPAISPISFLTCTNTLGNSLFFSDQILPPSNTSESQFALPTAVGGLSGDSLHALALGNVYTFSQLLRGPEAHFPALSNIRIIGVGGVTSKQARERMIKAGADAVACATLLGKEGVRAFEVLSTDV
jgi:dihydroorotate dehydrogenase (fumarate)